MNRISIAIYNSSRKRVRLAALIYHSRAAELSMDIIPSRRYFSYLFITSASFFPVSISAFHISKVDCGDLTRGVDVGTILGVL